MPDNKSAAELTGGDYELANAGYTPMPDPDRHDEAEAIGGDSASLREAAAQRAGSPEEVVVREYRDQSGKPVAASEAITLSRASRDYAGAMAAEKLVAEAETSKELAARVDALRAEALTNDPDAVEFYGFDPLPETTTEKNRPRKIEPETLASELVHNGDETSTTGLDPELEKALQHPQVRHAIEEQLDEAERSRRAYLDGLAAATQIAQVSFLTQFPDLANVPPENLPSVLALLSRQDPAKFARVEAMVKTTEQLFAQQRAEQSRQAEAEQQEFRNYARSEDARFETMLQDESAETQAAVTAEIISSAKASGIETTELIRLFNSEPVMRNAVFQRMMYDAGKYRLAKKARDLASARPLPAVQRPGVAHTPAEREQADLRTLSARLSTSGNIKDAVALYHARKGGRG